MANARVKANSAWTSKPLDRDGDTSSAETGHFWAIAQGQSWAHSEKADLTPVSGDMVGPMFRVRNIDAQSSIRLGPSEPRFQPVTEIVVHGRPGEAQRAVSFGQEETGADFPDRIRFAGRRLRRLRDRGRRDV